VEALIGKRPYGEKKPVHIVDELPEEHHAKSADEVGVETSETPTTEDTTSSDEVAPEVNGNGSTSGNNYTELLNQPPQYSK
jgi:hypothetical protein